MNKTINSEVRKVLHCMISKFQAQQQQKEALFKEKQDCLRVVSNFLENLEDVEGVYEIVKTMKKLSDLEQKDRLKTQNQYLEEIASITDVSVTTLKRIKKEGTVNEGVWITPGTKRPHKATVSNLDSFDLDAIRITINQFYNVKKEVPTLRSLLVELKKSIGFNGCRETLRRLLEVNNIYLNQKKKKIIKNKTKVKKQ